MASVGQLFNTVPHQDHLRFWKGQTLNARRVVEFFEFDKREVAMLAAVAPTSVRFDQKMPREVADRLANLANLAGLVAQFFAGDTVKTALWFKTRNPLLGDVSPREMILEGRYERLRHFVMAALMELALPSIETPAAVGIPATPGPSGRTDPPLIAAHRGEIERLCRRYGVRRLSAFGSIVREDFDLAASDVDFVVEFGPPRGRSLARQYFDFKTGLEKALARAVDLVEASAMPESRLKRVIERTQVPVYDKEHA